LTTDATEPVRPRPLWQVLAIGLVVGGWLFLALVHLDLRYGRMALPIVVSIATNEPTGVDDFKLGWQFRGGDFAAPRRGYTLDGHLVWQVRQAWIASLVLAVTPEAMEKIDAITVAIGEDDRAVEINAWPSQWPAWAGDSQLPVDEGVELRRLSVNPHRARSLMPSFERLLNYPGDLWLLRRALTHPVLITFGLFFAGVLAARSRFSRRPVARGALDAVVPTGRGGSLVAATGAVPTGGAGGSVAWMLAGLAVLVVCGVIAQANEPYYFVQDDNFSQFFPGMLYGCRSAFAGGFPAWNPHQLLGAPLAEVGTYALTYPFTYLSYALATYGLGDEIATVDVFAALHLVAGYFAFYGLARRLGVAPAIAAGAALSFVLSGYALIAGRSWYYMLPTFCWTPLLGIALLSLTEKDPGWGWIVGTGAVIGVYFHGGNAQMWAYTMVFYCLALGWGALSGRIPRRRWTASCGALAIGLGLAAPLLIPQSWAIRDLDRVGGGGGNCLAGLHAMLVPYPLGKAEAPADLGTMFLDYFGQLYYAGTLFTLAWLGGFLVAWVFPGRLGPLLRHPLFALGLVALLLCLGDAGVLWYVQARLPMLDKFKHPVKWLPMFHFFSLAAGALVVDRLTARSAAPGRWRAVSFAAVALLLAYHVSLARTSFYSFGDRPYPELPEPIARQIVSDFEPVRVMPVAQHRSAAEGFALSLSNYLASVYRVDSVTGHDPLVSFRPEYQEVERRMEADMIATLRRHGVKYLLVHATSDRPVLSANPAVHAQETRNLYLLEPLRRYDAERRPVAESGDLRLVALEDPDPMAFPAGDRDRPLPICRIPSGVQVEVGALPEGGPVVVNYLYYDGIRAWADGRTAACEADEFGRIVAHVPPGTRTLRVSYHGRWLLGLAVGACLAAVGAGWFLAWTRFAPGTRRVAHARA